MNRSATLINTTLAEVDALPIKPPKVELQYGSAGYDQEQSFVIKGLLPECSFASIYGPSGSFNFCETNKRSLILTHLKDFFYQFLINCYF